MPTPHACRWRERVDPLCWLAVTPLLIIGIGALGIGPVGIVAGGAFIVIAVSLTTLELREHQAQCRPCRQRRAARRPDTRRVPPDRTGEGA